MKNNELFNAAQSLVISAGFVKLIDENFCKVLLDKAEEYKNQIVIDEKLEKEIDIYVEKIKSIANT